LPRGPRRLEEAGAGAGAGGPGARADERRPARVRVRVAPGPLPNRAGRRGRGCWWPRGPRHLEEAGAGAGVGGPGGRADYIEMAGEGKHRGTGGALWWGVITLTRIHAVVVIQFHLILNK
jgi:hypothetical protein